MTDDSECFVPSNYIKNPENQEQKLKKQFETCRIDGKFDSIIYLTSFC